MTESYSGTANIPAAAVEQVRRTMESGKPITVRTPDGAETQALIVALDRDGEGAVATLVGWGDEEAFASWTDEAGGAP